MARDEPAAISHESSDKVSTPLCATEGTEPQEESSETHNLQYRGVQYEQLPVGYQCKSFDFKTVKRETSVWAHIRRVHPVSRFSNKSPPVKLDYYGVPDKKPSSRHGFKCVLCNFEVTRKTVPKAVLHLHIRRAHFGEATPEWRSTVYRRKYTEDKETKRITYQSFQEWLESGHTVHNRFFFSLPILM